MTLDEAIKHCNEVAEKNETKGKMIQNNFSKLRREQKQEIDSCLECASEHRQLAEWLLELRIYKRGIEKIKELKDGFNQIPLSLEASVLESALELLGEEGSKALEQQPCEDCIGREDVLKVVNSLTEICDSDIVEKITTLNNIDWIKMKINEIPSVTPSRPRGKWIRWTDDYKDYVTCSCCEYGEEGEVLLEDKTPFCPYCGADMREEKADVS